jgi:hypothetical protein
MVFYVVVKSLTQLKMSRFSYGTKSVGVHEDDREEDMAIGSYEIKSYATLLKETEAEKKRLSETMMDCPLCGTANSLDKYNICRCLQRDFICPECKKNWHFCPLDNGKVRTDHPCSLGCENPRLPPSFDDSFRIAAQYKR